MVTLPSLYWIGSGLSSWTEPEAARSRAKEIILHRRGPRTSIDGDNLPNKSFGNDWPSCLPTLPRRWGFVCQLFRWLPLQMGQLNENWALIFGLVLFQYWQILLIASRLFYRYWRTFSGIIQNVRHFYAVTFVLKRCPECNQVEKVYTVFGNSQIYTLTITCSKYINVVILIYLNS